jgi:hypothetical protein
MAEPKAITMKPAAKRAAVAKNKARTAADKAERVAKVVETDKAAKETPAKVRVVVRVPGATHRFDSEEDAAAFLETLKG